MIDGDPTANMSGARPLEAKAVKHASGVVYFVEMDDEIVIAESVDLRAGPSATQKLKEAHGTPLDLYVTLTDDPPSARLIENHYSLTSSPTARLDVERFTLSTLRPAAAPCAAGLNFCTVQGNACDMSALALLYVLSTGNPPDWTVGVLSPGQITGGGFASGIWDFYFSACSNSGVTYTMVNSLGGRLSLNVPAAGYFFLNRYGNTPNPAGVQFTVGFSNPQTIGVIFGIDIP